MFNLLYKELKLAAHPTLYIFALMGFLVIIPNYPYGTVFLYGCLAPYITFTFGKETRDIYYTVLLPIKKQDVVKGKIFMVMFVQIIQLLLSVPFAIIRVVAFHENNPVGIEANVAYYGVGLIIFAISNLVFFSEFFKTAYKAGKAFIFAIIPATILITAMEVVVHIPKLEWIDSTNKDMLIKQIPILLIGVLIYALSMIFSYKISASRFEKVDL